MISFSTGGGGAVLTGDPALGDLAEHLASTAKVPHPGGGFTHDRVAYNYRMPNLNAALGCAQLEQLPRFLRQKRGLAERYRRALGQVPGVQFFTPPYAGSNHWLNTVTLPDRGQRDALAAAAGSAGISTRPPWVPLHWLPMFSRNIRDAVPVAERVHSRALNIPSSAFLVGEDEGGEIS